MHTSQPHLSRRTLPALISLACAGGVVHSTAVAGPTGGQVVGGTATISSPDAATTVIDQASHKAVLDWQTYNVDVNELVQYNQPSSSAQALNRIFDQNASQILGTINANGHVYLMNPNGVIFGETASINVNSIMAATGHVGGDEQVNDFLNGQLKLQLGDGKIVNRGLIAASTGGRVTLLGKEVVNTGQIIADYGKVEMASGSKMTLDFDGDGLIRFTVDEAVLDNPNDAESSVLNTGTIEANGGSVLLSGNAAKDVFSKVVNNTGMVKAGAIDTSGGVIRLVATGGDTYNSGTLDATQVSDNGDGGSIHILGDRVAITGDAVVSADGKGTGNGGEILIGGDFQGSNPDIKNAEQTLVTKDALITANAGTDGDGGKVIVWADNTTQYYGEINAKGGSESGDGGFVEVSGKKYLQYIGWVDVTAENGEDGSLLLDPGNIEIRDDATATMDIDISGTSAFTAATGTNTSVLLDTTLTAAWNGGNVSVVATADAGNGEDGDITIFSGVSLTSTNTGKSLSITADNDITVQTNVTIGGTDEGAITLDAGNDLTFEAGAGTNATLIDTAGAITLTAGNNLTINDNVSIDAGGLLTLSASNDISIDNSSTTATLIGGAGMDVTADNDVFIADGILSVTGAEHLTIDAGRNVTFTSPTLQNSTAGKQVRIDFGQNTAGTLTLGSATLTSIQDIRLRGGTSNDVFNLDSANITAGDGRNIRFEGDSGDDTFNWGTSATLGFSTTNAGVIVFEGETGSDTLNAPNTVNTWSVTNNATGSVNTDYDFITMEILVGGSQTDTFTIDANDGDDITSISGGAGNDSFTINGNDFAGTINAGGQTGDTLNVNDTGTTSWSITGAGQGQVTYGGDTTVSLLFSGMSNLTGSLNENDNFTFAAAGTISGLIDGNGGTDNVDYFNITSASTITLGTNVTDVDSITGGALTWELANGQTWTLTGAGQGTVDGMTFKAFDNLTGTTGDDTFTIGAGGTLNGGTIDGGGQTAADLITGPDTTNTWEITGAGQGNLNGTSAILFTGIESLTGGSQKDTYQFATGGSVAGDIDGGGGANTFDYNTLNFNAAVTIDVANVTASGVGGTVAGVTNFIGDNNFASSNTLIGADANVTWVINGADTGTAGAIQFTDFGNLTGGTLTDTFQFASTGSLSGNLDGGSGTNTLDYDAQNYNAAVAIDLENATATGIGGTVANVNFVGDSDFNTSNTLTGANTSNNWTITGQDDGTVGTVQFTDMGVLNGGALNDSFTLNGGSITGSINGGSGSDTVIGDNTTNTWNITGSNAGNLTGVNAFTGIENLTGGSQDDTFNFTNATALITGTIAGAAGTDKISYAGLTNTVTVTAGNLNSIEQLVGSTASDNVLIGADANNTWNITGQNDGTVSSTLGTIEFTNFQNLSGGTVTDTFNLNGGSISGTVSGGLGNDTIANGATYTIAAGSTNAGTTTKIGGGFSSIENLTGSAGTDTFNINGTLTGNVSGLTGDDSFIMGSQGAVLGTIDGGAGTGDTINYSALTGTISVQVGATVAGLTNVENVVGNGANSTLIGDDANNTWVINGTDTGTIGSLQFTNFHNLTGGSQTDSFQFASSGSLSGNLDGGSGTNTLDYNTKNYNAAATVDLANSTASGVGGTFAGIGNIVGDTGSASTNNLIGPNASNNWTVTGADDGVVGTVAFTDMGILTGGTVTDTFTINGGSITGSINGGSGSDTIIGDNTTNTWNITTTNAGNVTNVNAFASIENLTGGTMDDTFNFTTTNSSITGTIDGGNGTDTVDYSTLVTPVTVSTAIATNVENLIGANNSNNVLVGANTTNTWNITGTNAGTVGSIQFTDFQNLTGGTAQDTFNMCGGSLTGAISDNGGTNDTIAGATSYTVSAGQTNAGNAAGITGGFTGIENLTGSAGVDTFNINGTLTGNASGLTGNDSFIMGSQGAVLGTIDGGAGTGDTINYSALTGTISVQVGATVAGLTNVENVVGNGANSTLIGDDANNIWVINGTDTGTIGSLQFTNFHNLTGGSQTDSFQFASSGSLSGNLDGGSGTNTLDYNTKNYNAAATVDLANSTASGVGGTFAGIGNIVGDTGSASTNNLIGPNASNNWTVTGADDGVVGTVAFTDMGILTGGTVTDTFTINGGSITGSINGGSGSDTIIGDNTTNTWNITGSNAGNLTGVNAFTGIENLTGNAQDDTFNYTTDGSLITGTIAGAAGTDTIDYSGVTSAGVTVTAANLNSIEQLVGTAKTDTLIGANTTNTWNITGVDDGTVGGLQFTSFENLTGGTSQDTFNLNGGSLSGSISDNGGTNDTIAGATTYIVGAGLTNAGTAAGITGGFTGIENLTGTAGTDTFQINGTLTGNASGLTGNDSFALGSVGSVQGNIDGGAGTDAIDYSALTGTVTVTIGASVAGLISIEDVVGNGVNTTLIGEDSKATWDINGLDRGVYTNTVSGTTMNFTGVGNLTGGSGSDTFDVNPGGSLSGAIDGGTGAGIDTVDYSLALGNVSVDLGSGTATSIAGGITDIERLIGNGGNNTLAGLNTTNTWNITGADDGTVGGLQFTNFGNLVGGSQSDTFSLTGGGSISGSFNGGSGNDTLAAGNTTNNWSITGAAQGSLNGVQFQSVENLVGNAKDDTFTYVNAAASVASITGGAQITDDVIDYSGLTATVVTAGSLNGIESIIGNAAFAYNFELIGDNTTNNWAITGADSGSLNGTLAFVDFANLTGGSGTDTFTFNTSGSLGGNLSTSGSISGGGGSNDTIVGASFSQVGQDYTIWYVTGPGTGSVNQDVANLTNENTFQYDGIENITGGAQDDYLWMQAGADLVGTFDGGGFDADGPWVGNVVRQDNAINSTYNITGAGSGSIDNLGGFANIQQIYDTGSTADNYIFGAGGSLAGAVTGWSGNALYDGTGANDTITGGNGSNNWTVSGANVGTLNTTTFFGIENLTGGSATDNFTVNSILSGNIIGGDGTNTYQLNPGANVGGTITGGTGTDTFIWAATGSGTNGGVTAGTLSGGGGSNDTLIGPTYSGTSDSHFWTITGTNAGTISFGSAFDTIENLTGGNDDDFFFLNQASDNITGNIDGGGFEAAGFYQGNIIAQTGNVAVLDWFITGAGSGSVTNVGGFSNIEAFWGGTATDTFTFGTGGSLAGGAFWDGINGTGGNDEIVGANTTNAWTIDAANAGLINGTTFRNVENLTGGNVADTFTFAGGSITGNLDGKTGNDTIVGGTTYNINGSDTGTANMITGTFANVENLTGTTGDDQFIFGSAGSLSGQIDGLGEATEDTVDYSAVTSAFSIQIGSTTSGLTDIENIIGNGTYGGTFIGPDADRYWYIPTIDEGWVNTVGGSATVGIHFSNFENITGGSQDDTFVLDNITATAQITGLIDGGGGINTLKAWSSSNTWTVAAGLTDQGSIDNGLITDFQDIQNFTSAGFADAFDINGTLTGYLAAGSSSDTVTIGAAGSIGGTVSGGSGIDTLVGNSSYTVAGANTGTANLLGSGFTSFENLTGTTLTDTFNINGTLSGDIRGLAGSDTITIGAAGSVGGTVFGGGQNGDTLEGNSSYTVTGVGSGSADLVGGGFNGIHNLTGTTGTDSFNFAGGSILGNVNGAGGTNDAISGNSSYSITGADQGSGNLIGGTFAGIANLTGTAAASDSFVFGAAGSLSGLIDGGAGVGDEVDYTALTGATVTFGTDVTNVESLVASGGTSFDLIGGSDWTISGVDAGTVDGIAFDGFGDLTATAGTDSFTINGGILTGSIAGLTGADSLIGSTGYTVNALDAGDATFIANGFSGIQNLTGTAGSDTFAIGSTLSGSINGGNGNNTYNLSGGGVVGGNITGGSNNDTFNFSGGSVTGSVDGGSAGTDTLDYSGTSTTNIQLTGLGTNHGFAGNATSTGGFDNITHVVGGTGTTDTITGMNATATWSISNTSASLYTSGGQVLNFGTAFENYVGGSASDNFTITSAISGQLTAGNVFIDGGNPVPPVAPLFGDVLQGHGSLTGVTNIETLSGSGGTLFGGNNYTITGLNSGFIDGVGFINYKSLSGTDANYSFSGGSLQGGITDTGGSGSLDITFSGASETITLDTTVGSGNIDGGGTTSILDSGFSGIATLTGATSDTLEGSTGQDSFFLSTGIASIDSSAGSVNFGGFGTYVGGDTNDIVAGSGTFTINNGTSVSFGAVNALNFGVIAGTGATDTLIGTTGSDTFNVVDATSGSVAGYTFLTFETLDGRTGNDTFNFGFGGSLDPLGGSTVDVVGGAGSDTININDGSDTTNNTYAITNTQFARTNGASVVVNFDNTLEDLTLNAGTGDDSISISGGSPGSTAADDFVINAGAGTDSITSTTSLNQAGIFQILGAETSTLANVSANTIDVNSTSIDLSGLTYTSGTGGVALNGNVDLAANSTSPTVITSGGGSNITITGTVDDTGNDDTLQLVAGAGNVDLQDAVGGGSALESFIVTSANIADLDSVTADGAVNVTASRIDLNGANYTSNSGAVTFNPGLGSLVLAESGGTTTVSGATGVTINGVVTDSSSDTEFAITSGGFVSVGVLGQTGAGLSSVSIDASSTVNVGNVYSDGKIDMTGATIQFNGSTYTSNSDAISLTGNLLLAGGGTAVLTSGGGAGDDITVTGTIRDTAGENLTLNAGASGNIDLQMAVGTSTDPIGAFTITNAASADLQGDVFASSITTNANTLNLYDQTYAAVTGNVLMQGGTIDLVGSAITTINATAGSITLTSSITDSGSNSGIAMEAGTFINMSGVETGLSQDYTAPSIELVSGNFVSTNGSLNFNGVLDLQGTGSVLLQTKNANDISLTGLQDTGGASNIAVDSGADINLTGSIVTQGNQLYQAAGDINIGGTVAGTLLQSNSGDISFTGPVLLTGTGFTETISATNGSITFQDTIDDPGSDSILSLIAGDTITMNKVVGGGTAVNTLSANATNQIDVSDVTTLNAQSYTSANIDLNGTSYLSNSSDITMNGAVDLESTGVVTVDTNAGAGTISITGAVSDPGGDSALTLDAGTGFVSVSDVSTAGPQDYTGSFIFLNGATYETTAVGTIDFNNGVLLSGTGAVSITSAGGKDITFDSFISDTNGASSLTVDAGTGEVTLSGTATVDLGMSYTGSIINLDGLFYSSNSGAITFNGNTNLRNGATTIVTTGGTGNDITFVGAVADLGVPTNFFAVSSGRLDLAGNVLTQGFQFLTGTNIGLAGDTYTSTGGFIYMDPGAGSIQLASTATDVTINAATDAIIGSISDPLTGNALTVNSGGTTYLLGNSYVINGGDLIFSDAVNLSATAGAITIDTSAGGGDIRFLSTVDDSSSNNPLVLNAGAGAIGFADSVGNTSRVGGLDATAASIAVAGATNLYQGDATFNGPVNLLGTGVQGFDSNVGSLTFNDVIFDTGTDTNLALSAGNSVNINNQITGTSGVGSLGITAPNVNIAASGDITSNGVVQISSGNIVTAGDITTTADSITLGNTTVNGPLTMTANAGGTTITIGTLNMEPAGEAILIADTINTGNVTGTGSLALVPFTAGTNYTIDAGFAAKYTNFQGAIFLGGTVLDDNGSLVPSDFNNHPVNISPDQDPSAGDISFVADFKTGAEVIVLAGGDIFLDSLIETPQGVTLLAEGLTGNGDIQTTSTNTVVRASTLTIIAKGDIGSQTRAINVEISTPNGADFATEAAEAFINNNHPGNDINDAQESERALFLAVVFGLTPNTSAVATNTASLFAASEITSNLEEVGFIDFSLFDLDLEFFGRIEPGVRLPDTQSEDYLPPDILDDLLKKNEGDAGAGGEGAPGAGTGEGDQQQGSTGDGGQGEGEGQQKESDEKACTEKERYDKEQKKCVPIASHNFMDLFNGYVWQMQDDSQYKPASAAGMRHDDGGWSMSIKLQHRTLG